VRFEKSMYRTLVYDKRTGKRGVAHQYQGRHKQTGGTEATHDDFIIISCCDRGAASADKGMDIAVWAMLRILLRMKDVGRRLSMCDFVAECLYR